MLRQRTIAKEISVTGLGLHSGKKIVMKLTPAKANTGICFQRTDIENAEILKADAKVVGATANNTTIGSGENCIFTVEHVLSALYGFGIDNILIQVDGPEIPIMDSSAAPFVFLLKEVGVSVLNDSKKFLVITKPVRVEVDDKWAMIEPSSKLIIDSTIDFPHVLIKKQQKIFEFSCENYINEVSRARTFCMFKDVDMLKRQGLIKGGSLDNAIVPV